MSRLFLGKWWHWAIVVAGAGALWLAGHEKAHVVHFNAFILALLAATAVVIAVIVAGTRPGEQVTRDPLQSGSGLSEDTADAASADRPDASG